MRRVNSRQSTVDSVGGRALGVLLFLFCSPACIVSPAEEFVQLAVGVDTPSAARALSGVPKLNPWDTQGLFLLGQTSAKNQFPKHVRVSLGKDGTKSVTGTWPDKKAGIGDIGEGPSGEVQVSLSAPSGTGYTLDAVAWLASAAGVTAYRPSGTLKLDLVAGKQTDATLDMVLAETGSLEGNIRCLGNTFGVCQPHAVGWVDAEAQLLYPRTSLGMGTYPGQYTLTLKGVPVGRTGWLRIYLRDANNNERQADMQSSTYAVTKAGARVLVNLQVSCSP